MLSKIRSYPYDLVLSWNELLQLVDWDQLAEDYSIYISIALNTVLLISRHYINQEASSTYKTLKIPHEESKIVYVVKLVYYSLNVVSFVNFFWCMTSFKNYDLVSNDINQTPKTPSLFKIQLDTPEVISGEEKGLFARIAISLFDVLYHRLWPKASETPQPQNRPIWRLVVWNPSKFQLHFVSLFSPLNVLFVALLSPIGFANILFLVLLSGFLYAMLCFKYPTKLNDEFIVYQSLMKEYDSKFVNPRLNKRYVDKCVDDYYGEVELFYPDKRTKNFVTHN